PEQQLPGPSKQQQTSSHPSERRQTTNSSSTASTRTPPQRPAISRRPPTTRRLAAPGVKYFRRARPVPYESRSHAFAAPRHTTSRRISPLPQAPGPTPRMRLTQTSRTVVFESNHSSPRSSWPHRSALALRPDAAQSVSPSQSFQRDHRTFEPRAS